MKNWLAMTAVLAALVAFVPEAAAQKEKSKSDLYKEIAKLSQTKKPEDQDKAYALGKEYITRFGSEAGDETKKVRDFVGKYRWFLFNDAIEKNKVDEALVLGREVLKEQPENTSAMMGLVFAAYKDPEKLKDRAVADEMAAMSRKAVELIEAGKATDGKYDPFSDKNSAHAYMLYFEGHFTAPKDKKAAAVSYYKSALVDSPVKTAPAAYSGLVDYYESAYEKFSAELTAKKDSMSDAEFNAATAKNNLIVDMMLDAYARAVKYGELEKAPQTAAWKARLKQVYTYRKKSDAGLDAYISGIEKTPLPDPSKL